MLWLRKFDETAVKTRTYCKKAQKMTLGLGTVLSTYDGLMIDKSVA